MVTHPLTNFVRDHLAKVKVTDEFTLACALGAPGDKEGFDHYVHVAKDALDTMVMEGNLHGEGATYVLERPPRKYAVSVKPREYSPSDWDGGDQGKMRSGPDAAYWGPG